MKLLNTFKHYGYSNQIGPGVYDIHSPRVPGEQEIKDRLKAMLGILPDSLLFVNPVSIWVLVLVMLHSNVFVYRTVVSRLVAGRRLRLPSPTLSKPRSGLVVVTTLKIFPLASTALLDRLFKRSKPFFTT